MRVICLRRRPGQGACAISMVSIIILAAVSYGAIVSAAYVFQRHLLYFPTRSTLRPAEWDAADLKTVTLETADGLRLTAWYHPPQPLTGSEPHRGIVFTYFHGNASHIGRSATKLRPLLAAGHGLLLVEYRGYAGNPGRPSEAGLYADGHAALRFLAQAGIDRNRIVLYGESLGSGVAAHLAAEVPDIGAVVLEAPFTSIPDAAAHHYFWLPVHALAHESYQNIDKIPRITAPLLILHGERDGVVPVRHGHRLYEAATEPKRLVLVAEGRHSDLHAYGGLDHILAFVRTYLPENYMARGLPKPSVGTQVTDD